MSTAEKIPLLVIGGPTATGKTAMGVQLAKTYDGEVVSADSMQLYEGMDIATAKPTAAEMDGVPHHLVGCVPLTQSCSASEYVDMATPVIADIFQRGKLPLVVGGTGFYISALVFHPQFSPATANANFRAQCTQYAETYGDEALHQKLQAIDPESAARIHPHNRVRVIRALEIYHETGKTATAWNAQSHTEESPYRACILGLMYETREELYQAIDRRVLRMVQDGLVEEARRVYESCPSLTAAQAIGIKELYPYFAGNADLADCIAEIQRDTRHYAKRQLTWFKKIPGIMWITFSNLDNKEKILEKCKNFVAKTKIL